MPKNLVIYVDFDSTLYNTSKFSNDLRGLIAGETGLNSKQIREDGNQYFADPNLGGYDYEAHIRSYGLEPAQMWQLLDELAAAHDYLYDDSRLFMQTLFFEGYRPHILSFGEPRFQTAKIQPTIDRLSGPEHELRFDVVTRKKNGHIADLHPGEHGILIDDKPDQDLPKGFIEVTLDRTSDDPLTQTHEDIYVARGLMQTLDLIRSLA